MNDGNKYKEQMDRLRRQNARLREMLEAQHEATEAQRAYAKELQRLYCEQVKVNTDLVRRLTGGYE